ncbi:MAG: hypothetical protein HS117_21170 [Verrucomicrobiaceae bacterium]|nr:hypothetical protein [Verrucomicrobiaceae bacterium]
MKKVRDLVFLGEGDDPDLDDAFVRWYCSHVFVRTHDHLCYRLDFYVPRRLLQDAEVIVTKLKEVKAYPYLVLVHEIRVPEILRAVRSLEEADYFSKVLPVEWVEATSDDLVVPFGQTAK